MAILTAILSLIGRELSTIVQAIFGWSITALFGKLPARKQAALSLAIGLSVVWPFLLLGCFVPGAAAWALAFLPLKTWVSDSALRLTWITLALVVPLAVGAIARWITPKDKLHGGWLFTLLGGYVMIGGYFAAFVVTALTVPIVKIVSMMQRWDDCHVYVQPKEGRYEQVLEALARACDRASVRVTREDVPRPLALATTIVQLLARPFLEPIVASKPQRLRGGNLELYLYPADLLLRGEPQILAHVRAAMTRTGLEKDAYLVQAPEAQKLQDETEILWRTRGLETGNGRNVLDRLRTMSRTLDRAPISFDEWTTLETILRRLEHELTGQPDLLQSGSDEPSADQADGAGQEVGRATAARGGHDRPSVSH
jgi:uncharacterized membrane protein YeaQ/YmgE (transglycosylase-associated protein family)